MISFSIFTDRGTREINEDYVLQGEKNGNYCFVVADGLGGHGRGEDASELVANEMMNVFYGSDNPIGCFSIAFEASQKRLMEEQQIKKATFEMKTTAVMLVITKNGVARWGHIGDSRLYYFKGSKIKKQTKDHSVPQMLVMTKEIKSKDIRNHPDRNKLLRVMGVEWNKQPYEISDVFNLKKKSSFLLCTDGFWENIDENQMQTFLKTSADPQAWLDKMSGFVSDATTCGDADNYTAATVFFEGNRGVM